MFSIFSLCPLIFNVRLEEDRALSMGTLKKKRVMFGSEKQVEADFVGIQTLRWRLCSSSARKAGESSVCGLA